MMGQNQPTYQPTYQPQQRQPQSQSFIGRYVNNVDEIFPNEIAMDGSVSLFPKSDMTEIYAKAWRPDNTIQTVVYKPIVDDKTIENDKPTISLTDVMNALNQLQDAVNLLSVSKTTSRKKEVKDDV